jgi:ankyrin repeat protein
MPLKRPIFILFTLLVLIVNFSSHSWGKECEELATAAEKGDVQLVKKLLQEGADAKCKTEKYNMTVLMRAAKSGVHEAMKLLINKGADVNAKDNNGKTVTMYAVVDAEAMRILIENGANLNASDNKGKTVLTYAKEMAKEMVNDRLIKLLKEAGAKE